MKVCINYDRCQGQTMCFLTSPEVFDTSPKDGRGVVLLEEIPPALEEAARRAAANCPEGAIEITE